MRDRSWKFWLVISAIAAALLFVLLNTISFLTTTLLLDEEGVVLSAPPPIESSSRPTPPASLPAGKLEDIDFTQYNPDLAKFVGLEMGESRLDTIDKIRLYLAPANGGNIIQMTSSTFERDDGSVMVFAKSGLRDDSVKAEEIYAVFSGPGGTDKFNQKLAAYGMRIKCHRGKNTTEWQTDLCP